MTKLGFLLEELRRNGVIGAAEDMTSATILYQDDSCVMLRYLSVKSDYRLWAIVRRSSRQYFKVVTLMDSFTESKSTVKSFRNYRLTADYLKKFIRR